MNDKIKAGQQNVIVGLASALGSHLLIAVLGETEFIPKVTKIALSCGEESMIVTPPQIHINPGNAADITWSISPVYVRGFSINAYEKLVATVFLDESMPDRDRISWSLENEYPSESYPLSAKDIRVV